jgi:hypothetical protein
MPIHFSPIPENLLLRGHTWTVKDEDLLACLVAKIYIGRYLHVEKILKKLTPKASAVGVAAAEEAKSKLRVEAGKDPWHRDGLLFQAISWIAAHNADRAATSVFSLPHQIPAHKGFDGLQIELDKKYKLRGLVIFEDKATEDPRSTLRQDVWPELERLHRGERQTELMQEMTALLQRASVNDADEVIEGVVWKRIRRFRVSVTGRRGHDAEPAFCKLFKGYDLAVPGTDVDRRRAEVFCLDDLRPWMCQFANKVCNAIDGEKTKAHV